MDRLKVMVQLKFVAIFFVLSVSARQGANGYNTYLVSPNERYPEPHLVPLHRQRRDLLLPTTTTEPISKITAHAPPSSPAVTAANVTADHVTATSVRATAATASTTTVPPVSITKVPRLLGVNGTGILRVNITAAKMPQVSDPLYSDDNFTDIFKATQMMKSQPNINNLTYDSHHFYNSTFIGNSTYFDEYWANLTKNPAEVHAVLSYSHRRATPQTLKFDFPFYGHPIRNITVATGGFIYTGEHVHNWLAATQYIAPLMANFDTTLVNDSRVKIYNGDDAFIAFWENVTVQEDTSKKFTFAVHLYKNGDIDFAYKHVPMQVQNISDKDHPVKVGISDAYLHDKIVFLIRQKTIYEYHRVSFRDHEIASKTILRLIAQPTCLQYDTCDTCVNHDTGFDCMWCDSIQKCSSGTDRNKQNWLMRSCDKNQITNEASCPASPKPVFTGGNTVYVTETDKPSHVNVSIKNIPESNSVAHILAEKKVHSAMSGAVAALVCVTLVCAFAAWVLYAFKNPHTRSGQLLIKYRPSQWSWRRGEARYTAATIHM